MRRLLQDIYTTVLNELSSITFSTGGWEGGNFLQTEKHYAWLAGYVRHYNPKKVIELGRRNGNSLFALSQFLPDSSVLESYDIVSCGNVIEKSNVKILVYDGDFTKINLESCDFIYVDINGGGSKEKLIHEYLKQSQFKGICAYDDISSVWCNRTEFWDSIMDSEKLETDLHGDTGFGLILY